MRKVREHILVPEHDLISAQRNLAGRLHHHAGRDMERAHVHAALDHVPFDHAVGEAGRRVGAFVVGGVERPVDVVDRKRLSPTANALTEPGATSDLEQTRTTLSASPAMTGASLFKYALST